MTICENLHRISDFASNNRVLNRKIVRSRNATARGSLKCKISGPFVAITSNGKSVARNGQGDGDDLAGAAARLILLGSRKSREP